MNSHELTPGDESLRLLLVSAVDIRELPDHEIELWLDSTTPAFGIGEEQMQRLVGKLHRLMDSDRSVSPLHSEVRHSEDAERSPAPGPRLISISEVERPQPRGRIGVIASLLASVLALISATILIPHSHTGRSVAVNDSETNPISVTQHRRAKYGESAIAVNWLAAKPLTEAPVVAQVSVGDEIVTDKLERRRVILPDDSVLYVNSDSRLKIATERQVELTRGEVFVEVSRTPSGGEPQRSAGESSDTDREDALPFEIVTPQRTVTALGTKFAVSVSRTETNVTVTQGRVKVSGVEDQIKAGQKFRTALPENARRAKPGEPYTLTCAARVSTELEWTRELMAAATGHLVATSAYSGGALVAIDPQGQSSRLSLRKYHVDVHIEDGFARTTIDQTYFNHSPNRLEGTFHFPLPTDASLSRLAMYVNGRLMEGGMAERQQARNTFEQIVHKMQDPALLEWVDGSTFKMRVFPLEPRQEKRIILSYSQRLDSIDGSLRYRFPAGHALETVRDWSAHFRVKGGASSQWISQSHAMTATEDAGDLLLDAEAKNSLMDRDLVVRISETETSSEPEKFTSVIHDGQQYLMLRMRPDLKGEMQRKPHHWVFLFEHAGDRNPLLARTQIEIIRTLLNNAEHTDTFSIVTASTRATLYADKPQMCSRENIAAAVMYLQGVHLVGALDLAAALKVCSNVAFPTPSPAATEKNFPDGLDVGECVPLIVHVGSGMPALGERDVARLAALIPGQAQYVGIGVGRRWNQAMMKQAASRTGGLSTLINPDEEIAWRSFDVFSRIHSPRLINVAVKPPSAAEPKTSATAPVPAISGEKQQSQPNFLLFSDLNFQGEEIAAICRVPEGHPLPKSVTVTAILKGQPWSRSIPVTNISGQATYLPRHWAKLEIDRLLAEDSQLHRESIVALSKSMYVMSPYTSLLVLENEEMYTQYNIDRGRKDHWALYPCPERIEVVAEDVSEPEDLSRTAGIRLNSAADVLSTIARLPNADDLASLTGDPWISISLSRLDPVSTAEGLKSLFNSEVTELPSIRLVPDGNRILVSGSAAQVMQVRQVLTALGEDGNGTKWRGRMPGDGIGLVDRFGRPEIAEFHEAESLVNSEFRWLPSGSDVDFNALSLTTNKSLPELFKRESSEFRESVDSPTNLLSMIRQPEALTNKLREKEATTKDLAVAFDGENRAEGLLFATDEYSVRSSAVLNPQRQLVDLPESQSPVINLNLGSNVRVVRLPESELWDHESSFAQLFDETNLRGGRLSTEGELERRFSDLDLLARRERPNQQTARGLRITGGMTLRELPADRGIISPTRRISFDLSRTHSGGNRLMNQHRWSSASDAPNRGLVSLPRFTVNVDRSMEDHPFLFGDLLSHASGLNTSTADVFATLEAETGDLPVNATPKVSPSGKPESNHSGGRVDDAARNLINRARSHGWESITLPGRNGEPGVSVLYDGHGRHVWERVVSEGLREHVVCDGATLWHIYREIGLASRRPFSRFHHRDVSAIVPWLLPSCEELSRNADVISVDQETVAIVPRSMVTENSHNSHASPDSHGINGNYGEPGPFSLHLIFAADGRLAERRFVEQASGRVVRRVTWDEDGTVRVLDGDTKEQATMNLHRSIAAAPELVPDLNGLVVLPMPVRTSEMLLEKFKLTYGNVTGDTELSEEAALSLMLAYTASGNGERVAEIARHRFIEKGDTREGLYVLLSRFPNALVQTTSSSINSSPPGLAEFDLRPSVEGSTLNQFIRQYINWLRDESAWQPDSTGISEFRTDAPLGSFLNRLATARNLYVRWRTDDATRDRTKAQIQREVERSFEFIATCRTPEIGWTLLSVMRPRLSTPELLTAYVNSAKQFEEHPQIRLLVQRERMIAMLAAGQYEEGRSLFQEWLTLQLNEGVVPFIGQELYNSAISHDGLHTMNTLLLESSRRLIEARMLMTMHSLIIQVRELGNTAIASQMMTMLLTSLDVKERPDVSLYAIEQLRRLNDKRADRLLDQVMELPSVAQIPNLWRFASTLAAESGRKRLAVDRLEKAIQLDFETRPSVINLETVRSDYTSLLTEYDELITAAMTLEITPASDLFARVIKAADQWRSLDDDDTAACQMASRLLSKLQQTELAWDYLATPLAENSGESTPWIALARSLGEEKLVELAEMAWTRAFEFEPTNPDILLEHARLLQTAGRVGDARNLLTHVVSGEWQPRFSRTKSEARDLLSTLQRR